MSWKDKLKDSQGGGSQYPQFLKNVAFHLEAKMDESKNRIGFLYYDRATESKKFIHTPIKGVLIGSSMRASGFDPNMGRNGGELNTSAYFTYNDNAVVFGFGKQQFKGTAADCCEYISNETKNLKKKKEVYILTENGVLISIKTSATLFIVDKDTAGDNLLSKFATFTPREYVPEEHTEKTHKYLGKFASTNRPKYAHIVLTDEDIDDDFGENILSPIIDEYEEFKSFTTKEGSSEIEEEKEEVTPTFPKPEQQPEQQTDNSNPFAQQPLPKTDGFAKKEEEDPSDSDLPF